MAESTITTEATGSVETAPESVQLTVEATSIAEETNTARQNAFDKATRIREHISETYVDIHHLETEKSILTDSSDTFDSNLNDGEYQATERLSVECSAEDASKLVAVISEVDGTIPTAKFAVSDNKRQTLKSQAVRNAMSEARTIAEAIADSEGLDIVGVSHVRRPPADDDEDPMESLKHAPGFNFHPDTITIAERVTVTYDVDSHGSVDGTDHS
ncbi:SIMPL domain-containing protein [Halonotius sp. GCM10025705]|uniref:SIMPL domain-containing protein n=1 Tax=Halonotius sp. GCM10025705 TaxID=3252678 RepID=UPI00361DD9AC